jgi:hypothetical protein
MTERGSVLGQRIIFWTLLVVCAVSMVTFGDLLWQFIGTSQRALEDKRAELRTVTSDSVREIDTLLLEAMTVADRLAMDISNLPDAEVATGPLLTRLRETLSDRRFYGSAITFAPYAYDPERRLYSVYYSRETPGAALEFSQVDEAYDYTTDDYDWYVVPMAEGNRWNEPYFDEGSETSMTTYSSVFTRPDPETGEPRRAGVVTVDLSMNEIRRLIEGLDLGPSGFGALTTREGTYLHHPREDYVVERRTLLQVAEEQNDPDRVLMAAAALRGEAGVLNHVSTTTGQESWLIFETVPTSGWSLQNTFIQLDVVELQNPRQQIILILTALLVFSMTLLSLGLRVQRGRPTALWTMSIVSTVLFVGAIGFIWSLALSYGTADVLPGTQVPDRATLGRVIASHESTRLQQRRLLPIYIPTGIHIETLTLDAANDLMLTGAIWQKFGEDVPGDVPKTFRFANASRVSVTNVTQYSQGSETVVLSSFEAAVRQNLDFTSYPLDQALLTLRVLPAEIDERVALVPDMDGYRLLAPSALPGLDPGVSLAGWRVLQSFFGLRDQRSYSSLGLEQSLDAIQSPDLHFNMVIRRNFLNSFLANLTPLILVGVMLFAILLLAGKVDYGRALSICVAMLFVVVFSHIGIRNDIRAENVFYLEYFYFVIYAGVLWVSLSSIREPIGLNLWFFRYADGQLPLLFYWPAMTGALLLITIITFY